MKKVKVFCALIAALSLILVSVGEAAPTVIMDATHHNGSFTDGPIDYQAGHWYNQPLAIPTGWVQTANYMYTTSSQWLQTGTAGEAVNNTGVLVQAGFGYTIQADLGGLTGSTAIVRVYATQNSDGSGAKSLLAQLTRAGTAATGDYSLVTVSATGTGVSSSLTGYYIQVKIGDSSGAHAGGYYDNIVVSSEAATSMTYMNGTLHNGSFTANAVGYWYNTPDSIPAGWAQVEPYPYTTAFGFVQVGSVGEAVNNTGELVLGNHIYTVSADLGGEGSDATVRVYATQNANGTGTKVLLADVHRIGLASDGYNLFNVVGTPGAPTPAALAGYYVQVVIGGPWAYLGHYLGGNYDNIVVTSEKSPITTYMSANFHNGSLTATATGFWQDVPDAIPAGWEVVSAAPYTTAYMFTQVGSTGEAVNNTGEVVHAGQSFTVSADLGGGEGVDATVRVYATKNADGTGGKVEVARVHRVGLAGDNYDLFNVVGTPGTTVPPNLEGYFVQVSIGGPYVDHYISGSYDNIVVTSEDGPAVTTFTYMDSTLHNGSMDSAAQSGFWVEDESLVPAGWEADDPNRVWTAAFKFILFDSPAGEIINNTGEVVPANHEFTLKADLGGVTGATATVSVYATQNADGTGERVLLADVSRPGNTADGSSSLFIVTDTGSATTSAVAGYFVQVSLKTLGNIDLNGSYDNIVVTSQMPAAAACGDAEHPYPTGDLNTDCYVDLDDLDVFAGQWLSSGCVAPDWCEGADISQDANVKFNDFAELASSWMDCTDPNPPCSFNP